MNNLIKEIIEIKRQKNALILAHNYQNSAIQDIADFTGDSLELAQKATGIDSQIIVVCGVRFMAETVKILNPNKKVLLPAFNAGCELANMANVEAIVEMKKKNPGAYVVSYVNTSAQVKAVSDVCCTSANAGTIVKNVPTETIIFLPDKNLGYFVEKTNPGKKLILWNGYCPVHNMFTIEELTKIKQTYPDAEILVHPECNPEIQDNADFILSTSGMLKRARISRAKTFIIGTEEGLLYRLKKENPDKEFFSLGACKICFDMKKTAPELLRDCLNNETNEIVLPHDIMGKARNAVDAMFRYG